MLAYSPRSRWRFPRDAGSTTPGPGRRSRSRSSGSGRRARSPPPPGSTSARFPHASHGGGRLPLPGSLLLRETVFLGVSVIALVLTLDRLSGTRFDGLVLALPVVAGPCLLRVAAAARIPAGHRARARASARLTARRAAVPCGRHQPALLRHPVFPAGRRTARPGRHRRGAACAAGRHGRRLPARQRAGRDGGGPTRTAAHGPGRCNGGNRRSVAHPAAERRRPSGVGGVAAVGHRRRQGPVDGSEPAPRHTAWPSPAGQRCQSHVGQKRRKASERPGHEDPDTRRIRGIDRRFPVGTKPRRRWRALGASHSHHRLTVPRLSGCTNAPAMPSQPPSSSATNTTLSSLVPQSSQYDSGRPSSLSSDAKYACGASPSARSRISHRLAASSRRTVLIAMS